jgi:hypothetical protein
MTVIVHCILQHVHIASSYMRCLCQAYAVCVYHVCVRYRWVPACAAAAIAAAAASLGQEMADTPGLLDAMLNIVLKPPAPLLVRELTRTRLHSSAYHGANSSETAEQKRRSAAAVAARMHAAAAACCMLYASSTARKQQRHQQSRLQQVLADRLYSSNSTNSSNSSNERALAVSLAAMVMLLCSEGGARRHSTRQIEAAVQALTHTRLVLSNFRRYLFIHAVHATT